MGWEHVLKNLAVSGDKQWIDFVHHQLLPKIRQEPLPFMVSFRGGTDNRPNVMVAPLGTPEELVEEFERHIPAYNATVKGKQVWIDE